MSGTACIVGYYSCGGTATYYKGEAVPIKCPHSDVGCYDGVLLFTKEVQV